MDVLSEFVYLRTYSRFLWSEGRRETYTETVDRFCNWAFSNPLIPEKVKIKSRENILNMAAYPSMRALWTGGSCADRDSTVIYNCAFLCVDNMNAFGETLINLMAGCGVGFSVQSHQISKLPAVKYQKNLPIYKITVEDSRRGWKDALDKGVHSWFDGWDCYFDFSLLRAMGEPLMTMGGRSSGPEVLRELLRFTRETILAAQGRQLTALECHDVMCEIARVVIVGGTRRSALISLSDLDNDEIRQCKNFRNLNEIADKELRAKEMLKQTRRSGANNSAVYYNKPDIFTFLDEWSALGRSGRGERGIANIGGARRNAPHRRKSKLIEGLNPCFRGDMRLLTDNGYQRFDKLAPDPNITERVRIINKDGNVSNGSVWYTGDKDCVELIFKNRQLPSIVCTPDHKIMLNDGCSIEAKDVTGRRIMPFFSIKSSFDKESFLAGYIQGDGTTGRIKQHGHKGMEVDFGKRDIDIASMYGKDVGTWRSRYVYDVALKYGLRPEPLPERLLPLKIDLIDGNFLSGLFSANGSITINKRSKTVLLASTCIEMLRQVSSVLVDKFNIENTIITRKSQTIKWENGTYTSKPISILSIYKYKSLVNFAENISFGQQYKRDNLRKAIIEAAPFVNSVRQLGKYPVYDYNEPVTNWGVVEGFIVSNCGEVALRSREFCNLSEAVVRPEDDFESLRDKLTTAAWLSVIQATHTNFPHLSSAWQENCEDERLCGVSLTGQFDNPSLLTPEVLKLLKGHVLNVCKKAAKTLGINIPAAVTSMKPSGTLSQVANCSPGLHPRWSKYYIRNIQIAINDPLFNLMRNQGVPFFVPRGNGKSTAVLSFPVASPKCAITKNDISAKDQLEWYEKCVENYTEHAASCTVYVGKDEWLSTANWVYDHFEKLNGLSFFPKEEEKSAYEWTPYQEISEEEYDRLVNNFPKVDFSCLPDYENTDQTTGAKELACAGGACEI